MNKLLPLLVFSVLLLIPAGAQNAFAQDSPDPSSMPPGAQPETTGDSTLTTSFTHVGNVAVATSTVAISNNVNFAGNFNLVIPAGSTVIQALMYTNSWTGGTATATVNAVNLGVPTTTTDPGLLNHITFRWDATAANPVNGLNPFTSVIGGGGSEPVYATLVVVYSNPANPNQQVIINDGTEILQNAGSTSVFNGVKAGAGTLEIVIGSGDAGSGSEEIRFNGVTLAGPGNIYNSGLGAFADAFQFPVPLVAGANSVDVITGPDVIVWPVTILTAPASIVGGEFLPIDSTALILAGLQSSAIWMLPVLAGAAGVGAFYIKTRMNKE